MSEFERPCTGLANCLCPECYLTTLGVISPDWDAWPWIWLSAEGREAMMRCTGQPPVRYTYPRQDWAGAIPWFDRAGVGLDFSDGGDDAW
jgi:hypothetical protein